MGTVVMELEKEHYRAELERVRAGFDGCGCTLCQDFYQTIDLKKFGTRVISIDEFRIIKAGFAGADLWDQYHNPEVWTDNGAFFWCDGKKYGIDKSGKTVVVDAGAEETPGGNPLEAVLPSVTNRRQPVTKEKSVGITTPPGVTAPVTAPNIDDVTARCRVLAGQGKSTRQISEILRADGVFLSHMTVARRLQAVLAL